MARTASELTPQEQLMIGELSGISNNRVIYKNSSGSYVGLIVNTIAGYTITNVVTTRNLDASTATLGDVRNVLGTLINDIQIIGSGMQVATYDPAGISEQLVGLTAIQTLTNKTLNSPVLTTPTLGVATATSINKVIITAPSTTATLTIANNKILTVNNTLNFSGTDSSNINFGNGGNIIYDNVATLLSLTSIGTIITGVWNGTAITDPYISSATTWNAKQNALVSGTNIKTINSTSLLGSGDITVQSILVSGTNIKTINSTSLLGSGDIAIPGLSWGSSISSTSGTGIGLTIGGNSADDTIGSSIIINATQTVATGSLYGYIVTNNYNTGGTQGIVPYSFYTTVKDGIGLNISGSGTPTISYQGLAVISTGNTNSAFDRIGLNITVNNNIGAGDNSGIYVSNSNTTYTPSLIKGGGIQVLQSGAGGTAIGIYGNDNVNTTTNGLVNYTLSNTQSGATTIQKIDLGTSAQAHTGLLVNATTASTAAIGLKVDVSTTGTGILLQLTGNTGGDIFQISGFNSNTSRLDFETSREGILTSRTATPHIKFNNARIHTGATTVSEGQIGAYFIKYSEVNNAGGSLTESGAVVKIENQAVQTAGTLVCSSPVLHLIQDNDSTGGHIFFNSYSGTPTTNGTLWFDGTNFKARIGGVTKTFTLT